jgi:MFS family permease
MDARIGWWPGALILLAALALAPSRGFAVVGDGAVSIGDRVRYTRADEGSREGTVVALAASSIVVVGDYSAWSDTVSLRSLESLEVRLRSFNMVLGLVGGVAVGAILGGAVAELAASGQSHEGEVFYPPAYWIGAPIGALVGGVVGLAYAHDRGLHWKRVALPQIDQDAAPNSVLQPAAPRGGAGDSRLRRSRRRG